MKLPRRQFLHVAAGAAALPAASRIARAQTYPTRPVRLLIGFAAGGTQDVIGLADGAAWPAGHHRESARRCQQHRRRGCDQVAAVQSGIDPVRMRPTANAFWQCPGPSGSGAALARLCPRRIRYSTLQTYCDQFCREAEPDHPVPNILGQALSAGTRRSSLWD